MVDTKAAKKKMTGTRVKQKRMGSIAMLTALFGILGAFVPTSQGGSRSNHVPVGRERREQYAKDHPDTIAMLRNKAAAKRERRGEKLFRDTQRSEANNYRKSWTPKPSSLEKFKWPRDYRGQLIKPRWANQPQYMADWIRVVEGITG
jgi:hypothetical protein